MICGSVTTYWFGALLFLAKIFGMWGLDATCFGVSRLLGMVAVRGSVQVA